MLPNAKIHTGKRFDQLFGQEALALPNQAKHFNTSEIDHVKLKMPKKK